MLVRVAMESNSNIVAPIFQKVNRAKHDLREYLQNEAAHINEKIPFTYFKKHSIPKNWTKHVGLTCRITLNEVEFRWRIGVMHVRCSMLVTHVVDEREWRWLLICVTKISWYFTIIFGFQWRFYWRKNYKLWN